MKERIKSILFAINKGIFEKDTELSMSLLAALAGESVILLGPPGVAKSMIARRLKFAFKDSSNFEYLMSRFSTPDEIFGPVSISKLKDADKYERTIDGYLPTADVVFLDEIWKAGPAIQNTLLTVINEKLFRNGEKEINLPLKLLVAASNELPTQGEGLEALWDRFLIRIECSNIRDEKAFNSMLLNTDDEEDITISQDIQISNEEYKDWSDSIDKILVPESILKCINYIRKYLGIVVLDNSDEHHNVYVSDRRWKKIVRLLRTSAFVNDRDSVSHADLVPIYNCLWQEPEEVNGIRDIVIRAIFSEYTTSLGNIKQALENDIRVSRQHRATDKARKNMALYDSNKKIYDNYYYHLLNHDTGNTYVFISDYQNMRRSSRENAGQGGIIYKDPQNPHRSIVRCYDGSDTPAGSNSVYLTRDEECIYINGVRFYIETLQRGEIQTLPTKKGKVTGRDFFGEIEKLSTLISVRDREISENFFVSTSDKKEVASYVKNLFKDIAETRQDLEKLEY